MMVVMHFSFIIFFQDHPSWITSRMSLEELFPEASSTCFFSSTEKLSGWARQFYHLEYCQPVSIDFIMFIF